MPTNAPAASASFRDAAAMIDDAAGKRVYPKKPQGRLYRLREGVAVLLLTLLFGAPFLRVDGHPLFLFNVFERKFVLLGYPFFPQDIHLFGLAMITFFVFIILFTVVFGRVWCGWACPQTIFMEMIFRKIEYLIEGDANAQKALDKAPWTARKIAKKGSKHLLFGLISFAIAHTFMAYLVGVDQVLRIVTHAPADHWVGFVSLLTFTAVFYLVFARLRELVCTVICPYGRLQSVLITKETILVAYDYLRGEPRGKRTKAHRKAAAGGSSCSGSCAGCTAMHQHAEKPGTAADAVVPARPLTLDDLVRQGDCVDCKLCVQVCPMGIDIRNGLQMECIHCTACIDACDAVMDKIGKPRGLIRFDSQQGIAKNKPLRLNARIAAYSVVLVGLLGLMGFLTVSRGQVETSVLRVPGMLYQEQPGGRVSNLYNVRLVNKTARPLPLQLKLEGMPGTVEVVGGEGQVVVEAGATAEVVCFIALPRETLHKAKTPLTLGVYHGNEKLETVSTNFLGPVQ
ncbi:MAG: 4Fe-4S binding protein [Cytophagales bacterium]|nr:4Fe-4S binding protein [Cytophagales bacterium]